MFFGFLDTRVNGNSLKGQNMDIHPELGSAIERNANWLKRVASNVCVSHIQQRIMDKKSSQFEAIERTGDLRTTVSSEIKNRRVT